VIGTLAFDGWVVAFGFGTVRRDLGGLRPTYAMLRCTGKVAPVVISGNKELSQIDRASTAHTIRRRTIRYDIVYLTCGKKLTCSQISPPHEVIYSNSVTFKSGLEVTQDHWKWHHSIDHIRVPISVP